MPLASDADLGYYALSFLLGVGIGFILGLSLGDSSSVEGANECAKALTIQSAQLKGW
jgi:ABC-type nitrate/sulfonate/bicarbonate transport system permease component